jgi:glycosyltransferase involved in cell wall biosynthesis
MDIKNKRILFVHSGSDLYGASRSLLRLSSRLARDGATVEVVLPHEGPLVSLLQQNGVKVLVQEFLPVIERQKVISLAGLFQLVINFPKSTLALFLHIRRLRPHLVHTMTAVILSAGLAARLAGVPHIWHVREFFGEFGWLWRFYQKYMVRFSTRLLCVSTPVAEQFDKFPLIGKIRIVHNGFPIEEFAGVTCERSDAFRTAYLLQGVKNLVGVVGRIKFQRKGQEVFVRAASLLRDRFPDARFLCIGSPFPGNESHLTNLLALIHELNLDGYVVYTGDVDDIKAAIRGLDILVLSSSQPEPFGGVVIEAMALSRPVVATNIGGSREQVVDGVTGCLVTPGDPEDMARGIGWLLESMDRRQTFGENGHQRYLEKFEFEAFYRTMLQVYEEAVENA